MFTENEKFWFFGIIISSAFFFAMILLMAYFVILYKKKQIVHLKIVRDLKSQYENVILTSQLEMQEQTFQHISKEIHDNIGQKLSFAKLHLNSLNIPLAQGPIEVISNVIKELRDLSRSLSSDDLLLHGLVGAIQKEVEQVLKIELFQIKFRVIGDPTPLPLQQELIVFRIVQEAFQNIVKHANAFTIEIQLHYADDCLTLHISDNGKGFDLEENAFKGMGLENMRKRASMIQGTFEINSNKGTGTHLILKIPHNAQK